ncbi:hypothetical protein KGY77_09730 [Candidatus Bipolaricaulota bacterium]|nr:hypothetical protein [Candidatus Bipolaricaulota bacterium]MBS3792905.1 hypothetical protein [Candidatus Bipolaricaulota bacterium]
MIIFDASTLILLAKVGLLRDLTSRVEIGIPPQIKGECIRGVTTDARLIEQLVEQDNIRILKVDEEETGEAERLKEEFSIGEEAYALQLAKEEGFLFATDDKAAIKACKVFGVKFTTAIDFLIRVYEREELGKEMAREKLAQLEKYGRYSSSIIEYAKGKLGGESDEDD